MPLVSVIMPMYNSEKYVSEAINSLLNQTFEDFEIIAINDGSKDGCGEVVSKIIDDRLVFVDDKENHGFIPTLNRCITMAKGKYIARLDDDDVSYPSRLQKQVEYMEEHPDVVLCGTHYDRIIDGETVHTDTPPVFSDEQMKFSLVFDNLCIPHSSFMMRRDALDSNSIRYETYLQVPDYHMQTCLAEVGKLHFIREPLIAYRMHATQSTAVRSMKMRQGEFDRARLWYLHRLPIDECYKKYFYRMAVRRLSTEQDYRGFAEAVNYYASYSGLTGSEDDRKCIGHVMEIVLKQQKQTPILLKAYRSDLITDIGVIHNPGATFSLKCLLNYNRVYLEFDYDENDDGMVDKHTQRA